MINNPAGLYGGGAFRVDSSAAVNYYLKRQAEEQAQTAALDKYFSHLMDKASPTGLRTDKEGAAFQQSIKNAQNYYTLNKKRITGGDIKAQQEYMELTNVPFQIMAASKEALATTKMAAQIGGSNTTARDRWDNNTTGINIETGQPVVDANGGYMGLYAHEQPIYIVNADGSVAANPKFKPFDPMQIQLNPEIYDAKKLQDYTDNSLTDIKPGDLGSDLIPYPKDPRYQVSVRRKGFTTDQLKAQAERIINLANDKNIAATLHKNYNYKTWIPANQAQYDAVNKIWNGLYKRDIANDAELYAALQIAPKTIPTEDYGTPEMTPEAEKNLQLKYQKIFENYKKSTDPTVIANADQVELGFERITPGTYGNVKIEGGVVKNLDGTPYSSPGGQPSVEIPLGALSTEIIDEFPTGTKIKSISGIKAIVENGKIKFAAIKGKVAGKDYGTINRTVLYNKQFSKNAAPIPINTVPSTQPSTPKKGKKGSLD